MDCNRCSKPCPPESVPSSESPYLGECHRCGRRVCTRQVGAAVVVAMGRQQVFCPSDGAATLIASRSMAVRA